MTEIANLPDATANLGLTESHDASICAALPRSSNGKTTDSDSVAQAQKTSPFRNLDGICSPRQTADCEGNCEPTNAEIIADLNRAKCAFQLRTICAVMGLTEHTLLKGQPTSQPHVKARVCHAAFAEQPMNITLFDGNLAALLPHPLTRFEKRDCLRPLSNSFMQAFSEVEPDDKTS